jgi:hypothetical protein
VVQQLGQFVENPQLIQVIITLRIGTEHVSGWLVGGAAQQLQVAPVPAPCQQALVGAIAARRVVGGHARLELRHSAVGTVENPARLRNEPSELWEGQLAATAVGQVV